jgi:Fe-S oxidoreductase
MIPHNSTTIYIFYLSGVFLALAFFSVSVFSRIKILMRTKRINRWDRLGERIIGLFEYMFLQKRLFYDFAPGLMHALIFWGYCIISFESLNFFIGGLVKGAALPFSQGIYNIFLEIFTVLVILAVGFALYRRLIIRPRNLNLSKEAYVILGLIFLLMLSYLTLSVSQSILQHTSNRYKFVTSLLIPLAQSLSPRILLAIHDVSFWAHLAAFLIFLNILPHSKHMHVLTILFNVFFRDLESAGRIGKVDLEASEQFGIQKLPDLNWKDVLDGFTCTECGRCSSVCPAHATQKTLNPKEIILDIKRYALASHKIPKSDEGPSLINNYILTKDVWSCTTCHACVSACPVFNEHLPKIYGIRQHQVLMEGDFPEGTQLVCRNIENSSNPWGIAADKRADVFEGLKVRFFADVKKAQYLFFVGCAGSFSERSKKVTRSFIQVLNAARVDFAVLGVEEKCNCETARRIGNEYLFQQGVENSRAVFSQYQFEKILTTCPHCFNTFKNEYSDFGVTLEVIHHTEFIQSLIANGDLRLRDDLDLNATFHDSCYMGRYNGVYEEPREILKTVSANHYITEMKNSKRTSFCCGAGGGRMWMEETEGTRINIARAKEAAATGAKTLALSCPFCMTMLEDGAKAIGSEQKVLDIAEITAMALAQSDY